MLDENLPSFRFQPSSDSPLNTVLYFSHNGSDPSAQYLLMRADPAVPMSKNKYAVALADVSSQSIIYAEVLVEPSWSQPTLSTAEIRAQNGQPPPPTPITPDTITLNLYNPDSQVVIRSKPGSWGKSDSWEFELPEQSFRAPSASKIDLDAGEPPISDLVPKAVFRWKKESRLGREMTCYLVGKSVGGKKSKEPDITVAMFKEGRHDSTVTIYEPNLRRVDVQDQKGLDIVLLLGAEVIRDLYLNPKMDPFNVSGAPPLASSGRRKDSRGASASPGTAAPMSGALSAPPPQPASYQAQSNVAPSRDARQQDIDAETKRLQAMVAEEERQARERERQTREQERCDAEEARRIKDMLNREEEERRRKQAEVDRETERLRKQYGVNAQGFAATSSLPPEAHAPHLPPRPGPWWATLSRCWQGRGQPRTVAILFEQRTRPRAAPAKTLERRPADPRHVGGSSGWWKPGPSTPGGDTAATSSGGAGRGGKKPANPLHGLLNGHGPYGNAAASVSNFFHGAASKHESKLSKKRSM
ncbi:conserved hypothetical protein [Verticillium alfalfae VaMs.102]|uniref:Uncharacterized protein n=1 Tax=Verticillium alfalfae (strain VaMs.102 / ATCC MYA-4576 / FGSC 10136) TaxID=526221 RepID=C9SSE4_VERA1|nr:conserved hypothetical protein [Verticillium alfalfae VaMs.102]EEY21709.1 conserved hypothetical protein [Verticillium alfalfae VaMs.102]